jgi:RNA polymerase sigma-70 factor (ECF subfamily)
MAEATSEAHNGLTDDDARDIRASLDGDGDAYSRLVDRHQALVAACMWRFTRDRGEWETLVQDVFVEAYYCLERYRGRGPFAAWLRTLATRVGYGFWKRQAKRRKHNELSLQDWQHVARPAPTRTFTPAEAAEIVHRLLAELPPRDRLVLTLLYLDGCSIAEASERTGWSETLVKVQAHRARRKLRLRLDQQETLK